jgi:hypothetical protein
MDTLCCFLLELEILGCCYFVAMVHDATLYFPTSFCVDLCFYFSWEITRSGIASPMATVSHHGRAVCFSRLPCGDKRRYKETALVSFASL